MLTLSHEDDVYYALLLCILLTNYLILLDPLGVYTYCKFIYNEFLIFVTKQPSVQGILRTVLK